MSREAVHVLVSRWLDAFRRRDPNGLAALYAPNGVMDGPMAGTLTGRDAIGSFYESLFGAFPDLTIRNERIVVDAAQAAVFSTAAGTQHGELFGFPASGRPMAFHWAVLLTVSDAGIEHEVRCYDFTGLLVQTGVLKAKPA
jgi:steroid delta-isomerase-like uncharacterized protein